MAQQGWISIHRKLRECWIYNQKPYDKTHAWIDLLLSANHQDKKILLGNELILVNRGSFITSELKLMERWGWSKTKLRNFLKILKNDSMIELITDKKKTIINIANYSSYQDIKNHEETEEEPHGDHEETTKRPQKDTNNNVNNVPIMEIMKKDIYPKEQVPYTDIVNSFNEICTSLSKVAKVTESRKKKMKARWSELKSLEVFENIFKSVQASNFLKGENKNNWKASFDWIMENDINYVKVLEDNYGSKTSNQGDDWRNFDVRN